MTEKSGQTDFPVLKPGIDIAKPGDPQPEVDAAAKKLYEETLPSVVQITTDKGFGSGWIMDKDGRIGSAAHVVLGSKEHYAVTADGAKYKLEIEKLDDLNDTVIMKPVKWKEGSRPHLDLAPSAPLKADDPVFAMGHPGGLRPAYLSPGYHREAQTQLNMMKNLSPEVEGAINQKIEQLTPKERPDLEKFINRDILNARIHIRPGDSGGPLLNADKKVIGINDMITSFEMGYFVPSEKIQALSESEGKFDFKYNWVASGLAQQYKHDWRTNPSMAVAETLGVAGAGLVGNSVLNKMPLTGGLGAAAVSAVMLTGDAGSLLNSTDGRDQTKYGLATAGDLAALGGAIATMIPKARLAGKIALGLGVTSRIGSEFVPNKRVLTDITRKDGSPVPPVSPDIEKSLGLGIYRGS